MRTGTQQFELHMLLFLQAMKVQLADEEKR